MKASLSAFGRYAGTLGVLAALTIVFSLAAFFFSSSTAHSASSTLTVHKDFVPDIPSGAVTVSVTCTLGGTASPSSGTVTESAPQTFTISGFAVASTCTATEGTAPAGYTSNETNCLGVVIMAGATANCTITNTQNSATFTVHKDFVPDNALGVTVSLACSPAGGTALPPAGIATEALPASFTVVGYTGDPTCTATETPIPPGYSSTATCAALLSAGTCTITNTQNSATLTVHKDFVPNDSQSVTVSVSCTLGGTPTPASGTVTESAPRIFTITGFTVGATCTATEGTAPAGYTANERNCLAVLITIGEAANCTITNTQSSAAFTVAKDFVPNDPQSVNVSVSCTLGGTPTPTSGTVSESAPRSFTITGFTVGATCTATEGTAPAGYTANETGCLAVLITVGGTSSCTITNTQNNATFTVSKDFMPDNALGVVTVVVTCTNGGIAVPPAGPATEALPFTTTVVGFTTGATCSVTEGVAPPGYTANEAACQNVPISIGGAAGCTITNTQNSATFTVNKDFVPDNPLAVAVLVTCTNGGIAVPPAGPATEALPFTTTIVAFTAGATCSATEGVAPPGYTGNEAACQNVPISIGGAAGCTITNTQNSAMFTVAKDFVPDSPLAVAVVVTCTNGGIAVPPAGPATEALPFTTTVVAFTAGATCSATEGVAPPGYTANEAACQNVPISLGGASGCTITNTQNTATFTVSKDFVPDNPLAVAFVVTCTNGGIAVPPAGPATEALPFTTTIVGFTAGATCSATEGVAPPGYTGNEAACQNVPISIGGAAGCTITNTQNTATFTVAKDFVPDIALPVTVMLSCSPNGGIVLPPVGIATEALPASFTVIGSVGDPLCTATETPIPVGYSSTGVCSALLSAGTCTITNTLRSATLTVNKDFFPDSIAVVDVAVICTSGIPSPLVGAAAEGSPFVTTITGFSTGATCTATEIPVPGYVPDESNCAIVAITAGGAAICTIVNLLITECPNVAPPWPVPPGDPDCDGFPSTVQAMGRAPESYIGTNPTQTCAATPIADDEPSPDAMPPDFNDDRIINGQDSGKFGGPFGAYNKLVSQGPFGPPGSELPGERFDWNGNGIINGQDTGKYQAYYNKLCAL